MNDDFPPPIEKSHGTGSAGLRLQADWLEKHLFEPHVLTAMDPFTGVVSQIEIDGPNACLEMVRLLRAKADEWDRAFKLN